MERARARASSRRAHGHSHQAGSAPERSPRPPNTSPRTPRAKWPRLQSVSAGAANRLRSLSPWPDLDGKSGSAASRSEEGSRCPALEPGGNRTCDDCSAQIWLLNFTARPILFRLFRRRTDPDAVPVQPKGNFVSFVSDACAKPRIVSAPTYPYVRNRRRPDASRASFRGVTQEVRRHAVDRRTRLPPAVRPHGRFRGTPAGRSVSCTIANSPSSGSGHTA